MKKRKFKTGAVRDNADDKLNILDYMDPIVLWRYGQYMKLAEKKYGRGNWKKGIPKWEYLSSLTRHLVKLWALEEGRTKGMEKELEVDYDHASAILFNIMGYMLERERVSDN